jgi:hypothetical protein
MKVALHGGCAIVPAGYRGRLRSRSVSRVLFAGLILAGLSAPVAAQEPPPDNCAALPLLVEALRSQKNMRAVLTLKIGPGIPAVIFADPDGNWQLVVDRGNGIACTGGAGTDLRFLPFPREDSI